MSAGDRLARSLLYVPGTHTRWLPKAWAGGADAVILDLEDGVAADRKQEARGLARAAIEEHGAAGASSGQLWVRVDGDAVETDLEAVLRHGLHGVVLPKAEPRSLAALAEVIARLEASRNLPDGATQVVALVETAVGAQRIEELAGSARVSRLALGEADLAADLGIRPDARRTELFPLRFAAVLASAAAGLPAPIGPVHTVIDDLDGLRSTCEDQLRQGFRARTAVHPRQVADINAAFSPSAEEIASARRTVSAFEAALASGQAVGRDEHGVVLDRATVRHSREVLARAAPSSP